MMHHVQHRESRCPLRAFKRKGLNLEQILSTSVSPWLPSVCYLLFFSFFFFGGFGGLPTSMSRMFLVTDIFSSFRWIQTSAMLLS